MKMKKCANCNNTGILGGHKSGLYCSCIKGAILELKNIKKSKN